MFNSKKKCISQYVLVLVQLVLLVICADESSSVSHFLELRHTPVEKTLELDNERTPLLIFSVISRWGTKTSCRENVETL